MALISRFLQIMVFLAASLLLIGGLIFLWEHGVEKPQYSTFESSPSITTHGVALMKIGIALLAITPLLTMIFNLVIFLYQKNFLYVVITLMVIGILGSTLLYTLNKGFF